MCLSVQAGHPAAGPACQRGQQGPPQHGSGPGTGACDCAVPQERGCPGAAGACGGCSLVSPQAPICAGTRGAGCRPWHAVSRCSVCGILLRLLGDRSLLAGQQCGESAAADCWPRLLCSLWRRCSLGAAPLGVTGPGLGRLCGKWLCPARSGSCRLLRPPQGDPRGALQGSRDPTCTPTADSTCAGTCR